MMNSHMSGQLGGIGLQQVAHAHMVAIPSGLAQLQPATGAAMQEEGHETAAKFKPIDLERLSPK